MSGFSFESFQYDFAPKSHWNANEMFHWVFRCVPVAGVHANGAYTLLSTPDITSMLSAFKRY